MKVLLAGHYPPPHGGVSVHVAALAAGLRRAGIPCRVLNLERTAPQSDEYLRFRSLPVLGYQLLKHTLGGWILHTHISGHGRRGWLMALLCGGAALRGAGSVLSVHSGLTPEYLGRRGRFGRKLVRVACRLFDRVVCVSDAIREALVRLGADPARLEVQYAFLGADRSQPAAVPHEVRAWMSGHRPIVAATMGRQPEYGLDLLIRVIAELRATFPGLGCIAMGSCVDAAARQLVCAHGLENAVLLAGDVSHRVCLQVIANADAFLRPTLADGDSLSVREALELGVPVLASDAGRRPPGTITFRTGDLHDLRAKLLALLATPPRAAGERRRANRPRGSGDGMAQWLDRYRRIRDRGEKTPKPCIRHARD
ncbi:MAG: glycosyltransferase [Candidatus Schekmanbacteria bacterium]|nr:glycosyltransferase [Candidatus Schekmanbacteria bacterium]